MLFMAIALASGNVSAQTDIIQTSVVKDGYVMMEGKMMTLKDGKVSPMKKSVKMANGTRVKKSGAVRMADGTKAKMKNGNCIDNTGTIENCNVNAPYYTCTMHPDVRAAKKGKCPKCGMDLVMKNNMK
jgi:hypothetical protein